MAHSASPDKTAPLRAAQPESAPPAKILVSQYIESLGYTALA